MKLSNTLCNKIISITYKANTCDLFRLKIRLKSLMVLRFGYIQVRIYKDSDTANKNIIWNLCAVVRPTA